MVGMSTLIIYCTLWWHFFLFKNILMFPGRKQDLFFSYGDLRYELFFVLEITQFCKVCIPILDSVYWEVRQIPNHQLHIWPWWLYDDSQSVSIKLTWLIVVIASATVKWNREGFIWRKGQYFLVCTVDCFCACMFSCFSSFKIIWCWPFKLCSLKFRIIVLYTYFCKRDC